MGSDQKQMDWKKKKMTSLFVDKTNKRDKYHGKDRESWRARILPLMPTTARLVDIHLWYPFQTFWNGQGHEKVTRRLTIMQKTIICSRLHCMARKNPCSRSHAHVVGKVLLSWKTKDTKVDLSWRRGYYFMKSNKLSGQTYPKEKSRLENKWPYGRLALSLITSLKKKKKAPGHIMVNFS